MQSILVNPIITEDKILKLSDYNQLKNINEYLLYADNILEGITLLNDLTEDNDYLKFFGVIYEPIDQPIYVFVDEGLRYYGIKICGAYDKWKLPKEASEIINYVDLPDYIFYSINNQKVILAGENTETASVGNSQWQREGRKLGAAKIGVPFIYQTFYSGRDESQDTIREPSALQVYNQLVYTVRYKTPSIVSYFENNFENSQTRIRTPEDSKSLLSKYIKAVLLTDADPNEINKKKTLEKQFFLHMIDYLKERKYKDLFDSQKKSRLVYDLPSLKDSFLHEILNNTSSFVDDLINYLYEEDASKSEQYINTSDLLNLDEQKFEKWTSYNNKKHINELMSYLSHCHDTPKSYIKGSAKVGFAKTNNCNNFLKAKFPSKSIEIDAILDNSKYPVSVIMPLRIHKKSNGKLTFSPDPESGEIVAFSELFSFDLKGRKKRPVIGYCTVNPPKDFDINKKNGTKLFKAIANYIDILIINGTTLITSLNNNLTTSNYMPNNLISTSPQSLTEEMAVVSTYLNLSTIKSNWQMCFIHTHHSSWQQLVIHNDSQNAQHKVDRVTTKVDLILQKDNIFMICEGKNSFKDIINDPKIQTAMIWGSDQINKLYKKNNLQFDAFVYNLSTNSAQNLDINLALEINNVQAYINRNKFDTIAYHKDYVIIIVYIDNGQTKFKLVYSPSFNPSLKKMLDEEFGQ